MKKMKWLAAFAAAVLLLAPLCTVAAHAAQTDWRDEYGVLSAADPLAGDVSLSVIGKCLHPVSLSLWQCRIF